MNPEMFYTRKICHADAYCAGRGGSGPIFTTDRHQAVMHGMPMCQVCAKEIL